MNKIKLSSALLLLICMFNLNTIKAQVTVGLDLGTFIPLGDQEVTHFGGNLSLKYGINDNIRAGLNLGYYTKKYADLGIFGSDIRSNIIPITGLFEYSFGKNDFRPYAGLDAGLYNLGLSIGSTSFSVNAFGIAPVFGFNYNISDAFAITLNTKYHIVFAEGESMSIMSANIGGAVKF